MTQEQFEAYDHVIRREARRAWRQQWGTWTRADYYQTMWMEALRSPVLWDGVGTVEAKCAYLYRVCLWGFYRAEGMKDGKICRVRLYQPDLNEDGDGESENWAPDDRARESVEKFIERDELNYLRGLVLYYLDHRDKRWRGARTEIVVRALLDDKSMEEAAKEAGVGVRSAQQLKQQFVEAIREKFDSVRKKYGDDLAEGLKRDLRELTPEEIKERARMQGRNKRRRQNERRARIAGTTRV